MYEGKILIFLKSGELIFIKLEFLDFFMCCVTKKSDGSDVFGNLHDLFLWFARSCFPCLIFRII